MAKGAKNGKNTGIPVLLIFLIVGLAMAIGGIVMMVDRKQKDSYYGTATGKITDVSHHTNSDGDDMYAAVYTYYVDDIEYTFTDDTSSSVRPSIGKRVDIRYNPEHPEIAYVGGRVWMGVILIGMGMLFILAVILGFVNGGDGPKTDGRRLASGLLMGVIVSAMGWGILFLISDNTSVISLPGIILSIFGILGIVVMVKSVKDYIAVKTGKAPKTASHSRPAQYEANARTTVSWDGNGAPKYSTTENAYQESQSGYTESMDHMQGQGTQNPYSGQMGVQTASYQSDMYKDVTYQNNNYQGNQYQNTTYQDNPVVDFYRDHKEGIDTTIRTVQKGNNIAGNIIMIAVGVIFVLSSLTMVGSNVIVLLMSIKTGGAVTLPAYIMPIVMEGIFLVVGIVVIVKGIKGIIKK